MPWKVVYENMLAKHNWYSELVALNDLTLIKEEV
jgi:hypothetical protein